MSQDSRCLLPPTQALWIQWADCQENAPVASSGSEKAMAPHSSALAWKIPWMKEPGDLQSMWSLRVGHD